MIALKIRETKWQYKIWNSTVALAIYPDTCKYALHAARNPGSNIMLQTTISEKLRPHIHPKFRRTLS